MPECWTRAHFKSVLKIAYVTLCDSASLEREGPKEDRYGVNNERNGETHDCAKSQFDFISH